MSRGRDSFNATFSSPSAPRRSYGHGEVTRKKTQGRRRFSRTTGIKDNPIRLELIPGELHFSSAKYYVMPLLLYTPRQPAFPWTLLLSLRSRFAVATFPIMCFKLLLIAAVGIFKTAGERDGTVASSL